MRANDSATFASSSSVKRRWMTDAVFLQLLVSCLVALCCYLLASGHTFTLQDFRCFYAAGQMLRHAPSLLFDFHAQEQWQRALVDVEVVPFYHPAYEALLYLPLTAFSLRHAYLLYAACNLLLLWLCWLAAPRPSSASLATSRTALLFLSFPVLFTIFIGQDTLWVLLAMCFAYTALTKHRDFRAGILIGLVTFNLATVLPFGLLIGIRRGRRFLVAFTGTFSLLAGLSVWLTGVSATGEFLRRLAGAAVAGHEGMRQRAEFAVSFDAMPNLAGLFYLLGSHRLGAHVSIAINLAGAPLLLGFYAWIQRRAMHDATAFSAALLGTVLVSPHLYLYSLSLLVLPFLLLSHRWLKYVALLWFVLPPALIALGGLTWFAPAVVIPIALLAICISEVRREADHTVDAAATAPAYP